MAFIQELWSVEGKFLGLQLEQGKLLYYHGAATPSKQRMFQISLCLVHSFLQMLVIGGHLLGMIWTFEGPKGSLEVNYVLE